MQYRGSESYLSVEQRQAIEDWLGAQATITVEEVRDEIEARYGIVYQSKQSYKALGMSASSLYRKLEDLTSGVDVKAPISVHERRLSVVRESHVRYYQ